MIEGGFSSASIGLTQNYIIPFALQLQATSFQIGLLTSIPNVLMSLSQLVAPNVTARLGSRKGTIIPSLLIDTLMWLPILLIPFLYRENGFLYFLMMFTFKTIAGGFAGPAWGSLMADLAAETVRGRYFSQRNMFNSACALMAGFAAMMVMEHFQAVNADFTGFAWLFGSALVLRLAAVALFPGMYEPPFEKNRFKIDSTFDTIRTLSKSKLGKFVVLVALTMFTMNMSGPFFAVYLLRDLQFDYVSYMIILGAGGVFAVFLQPFWGRRADVYGNAIILKIVTILMPLIPFSFIISANLYYLIGTQILSAFLVTGLNLAVLNYIFDATQSRDRTRYLAVFNMFAGLAACAGALIGGILASNLPPLFGYSLKTLFLISGIIRLLVVVSGLFVIREVRPVPQISLLHFLVRPPPRTYAGRSNYLKLMPDFKDEELAEKNDEIPPEDSRNNIP